jgi:hypothetical protein
MSESDGSSFYYVTRAKAGPFEVKAFVDNSQRPTDDEIGFTLFFATDTASRPQRRRAQRRLPA